MPLEHMGAVGDQRTLALIGEEGDVVHFSWPELDSPTVFAPLLSGDAKNFCGLRFAGGTRNHEQTYELGTNILKTSFDVQGETGTVRVTITDLMPTDLQGDAYPAVIRQIAVEGGSVTATLHIAAQSDYEKSSEPSSVDHNHVRFSRTDGPAFEVAASFALEADGRRVTGDLSLADGQSHYLVLGGAAKEFSAMLSEAGSNTGESGSEKFAEIHETTKQFWLDEIASLDCSGEHSGMMERSMLMLALLHMREHGSIAAAATFGYPEAIGGTRNWDYRFTWVRDSAIVAQVAARCGMQDIAFDWVRFVLINNQGCDRSPLNLMLALDGGDVLEEQELESWAGYKNSPPVRIGNEASNQLQLDIFGELMMALLTLDKNGRSPDGEMLDRCRELLDWLTDNWACPDSSIWELRGGEKHYLFSRLMSWLAFRDGAELFARNGRDVPESLSKQRDAIRADIEENFWCPDRGCYMQTSELPNSDAAIIYMRVIGFFGDDLERWERSKNYLRKTLVKDAGVLRYPHNADDGFDKNEGTFVICTTWWIEALLMDGEVDEAKMRFEKLREQLGNTGLMAEEVDEAGHQLGNLPQAFSHAGIISAAIALREYENDT